jgi:CubicO group peptidase (beta-lactamase class C family)
VLPLTLFFFRCSSLVIVSLLCFQAAWAQSSSDLFRVLKMKDSLLFQLGYNNCDIQQFGELISDNFEFYHDEAGMMSSKTTFISSVRDGLCKLPYKPSRELEESSLKVYPLQKNGVLYGAMQTGTHRFYAVEKNKPKYLTSTAKFTHVWMLMEGAWKLTRAYSYDHKEGLAADDPRLFKDRNFTEKWLLQARVPALGIGYIKDGKVQETIVYGVLNKGGEPAPTDAIFNVASLTKPITALVALKLIDQGKLGLDEPLYRYWRDPDIANDARTKQITARYILSHRTGFPNWRRNNKDGKLAFDFDPGTKYQYSGEGFEYLRKALEAKFRKKLDQLAKELVFSPSGMNDTRFYWDSTMKEQRFAKWHDGSGNVYETYKNEQPNAADDLLTTVEDYSKFLAYVINGAGLSAKLYREMLSEQARVKANKYWGLGWWVDEDISGEGTAILHGGDDKGVHALAIMLPKSKQGLLIFTNSDNGTDVYIPIVLHYLGKTGQSIIDVETK